MSDLSTLKALRSRRNTETESLLADTLYYEYCSRPKHRNRLTQSLRAALRAAANRVARHGPPPNYNQRLAYRMHKKRRAKLAAIALYGDPCRPDSP